MATVEAARVVTAADSVAVVKAASVVNVVDRGRKAPVVDRAVRVAMIAVAVRVARAVRVGAMPVEETGVADVSHGPSAIFRRCRS